MPYRTIEVNMTKAQLEESALKTALDAVLEHLVDVVKSGDLAELSSVAYVIYGLSYRLNQLQAAQRGETTKP